MSMGFECYKKDGTPILRLHDNVAALLWTGSVPALSPGQEYIATTIPAELANNEFFATAVASGLPNLNTNGIKPNFSRSGNNIILSGGQFGTRAMKVQVFVR